MSGTRFLALGDSYTIGEQVEPGARWPVQLAALLRAEDFYIPAHREIYLSDPRKTEPAMLRTILRVQVA